MSPENVSNSGCAQATDVLAGRIQLQEPANAKTREPSEEAPGPVSVRQTARSMGRASGYRA